MPLINKFVDTSEESKERSREILDNEFEGGDTEAASGKEKDPIRVAAGLKSYVIQCLVWMLGMIEYMITWVHVQHDQQPQRLGRSQRVGGQTFGGFGRFLDKCVVSFSC
jgi:hypothetical protein